VVQVPADKSISHRSLILNALAPGESRVRNLLRGEDVLATLGAIQQLGVAVDDQGDEILLSAPSRLREPLDVIDCGNSGTTMRLLAGVLAAESFFSVLTGDPSLRRRPMARVVVPLVAMGAKIDGRGTATRAPLAIRGSSLRRIRTDLIISSAQVKTALLVASRRTGCTLREPRLSRDHTELMLQRMGIGLEVDRRGWLQMEPCSALFPVDVDVPGDISSAAFFLVGGAITPSSDLRLKGVGVNPTRTGVVDVLRAMGADLQVHEASSPGVEPVADLLVRCGPLRGVVIDGELALRALDELPVLAIAAAFAHGQTTIADAAELRVKESDRISRVVEGLRALGVQVEERPDGMIIEGQPELAPPNDVVIDASGDHRIAMAFSVAAVACRGSGTVHVRGAESVTSSFPGFFRMLEGLRG